MTQQAAAAATQAFIDSYRGSPDYTAATVAALGSMRTAILAAAELGRLHHESSP